MHSLGLSIALEHDFRGNKVLDVFVCICMQVGQMRLKFNLIWPGLVTLEFDFNW